MSKPASSPDQGSATLDPRLARNYREKDSDEWRRLYRDWADTYDSELLDEFGYQAPNAAVETLQEYLPSLDSVILDMGCGTGLVGQRLHDLGYRHIDGLDLSPEMLEKARARGIYRTLDEADLTATLALEPVYDAVICVGVFSHQRRQPFDLVKLFMGLSTDGVLIATVNGRGWREIGWEALLEQSAREHGFHIEGVSDIPYLTRQDIPGKLLVIRPERP
ncbi:MAG: methyltransferase domain-containing protein [Arenicellales bacterium]|nr:methyltransferase domain-containing protein [Arenicellales bacterium]MDP6552917.1 methyltransferase domain-containing protein [Arenicellales bacterium]MDP6791009.1 methyltransferase domain-containing protein [Arenicellales bacterium]MDP6919017.1 methyltransferase domain-containing protein [Arenicellales bacterium]